jgi:hypothetical protein
LSNSEVHYKKDAKGCHAVNGHFVPNTLPPSFPKRLISRTAGNQKTLRFSKPTAEGGLEREIEFYKRNVLACAQTLEYEITL